MKNEKKMPAGGIRNEGEEDLLNRFKKFIAGENLFSSKDKLLLAVSGGVDSVVLCQLCYKAGYDFLIAHCNFQLRGKESERDEIFVKGLGNKYNREVLVKKFATGEYAAEKKISIQEAARELRYDWFKQLAADGSPFTGNRVNYILTAHHADDNIETLLMNFLRGTGIEGLHGILSKQNKIIRPLLFAPKEDILAYAKENKLDWVVDSSNESSKYTRNFFRNEVLPVIEKVYPGVRNNLANNIERFSDIEILYKQSIRQHKKKLLEQKGEEVHIPVLKLKKTSPLKTIVYEIIKEFNFSPQQAGEVISLLDAGTGKYILSATHRIFRNREWLIIAPLQTNEPDHVFIEEGTTRFNFSNFNLQFSTLNNAGEELPAGNAVAYLDAREIKFPLLLRKWKTGDYFYPLGMTKKKKLSRFFIDQKLSKTEKEKVWVLEMDKKIIWVVGHRIDERFKITGKTSSCLKIELGMR